MCLKYGKSKTLDKSAIDLILKYPWPGNIRQLKNALETAFVYPGETISTENINVIEIEPDTAAFFPKGWKGTCRVHETIRKVYMIR